MYHGKIESAGRLPLPGQNPQRGTLAPQSCATFEQARRAAAQDPDLSLLWQRLFDDSNP